MSAEWNLLIGIILLFLCVWVACHWLDGDRKAGKWCLWTLALAAFNLLVWLREALQA